jgi:hypothetical protein
MIYAFPLSYVRPYRLFHSIHALIRCVLDVSDVRRVLPEYLYTVVTKNLVIQYFQSSIDVQFFTRVQRFCIDKKNNMSDCLFHEKKYSLDSFKIAFFVIFDRFFCENRFAWKNLRAKI